MCGDEIELFSKIRQWNAWMNARNHAPHVQQRGSAVKERFFVGVEADSFVAEKTADVEEIACAASEIENAQRWSAIEPEILRVCHVYADPVSCIFVQVDPLSIGSIGILVTQPF